MNNITLNIYDYSELSKSAKSVAKDEIDSLLTDILYLHKNEIKESYNAFISAYNNGNVYSLNKDDCPLTDVCYDYDFIELLEKENIDVLKEAKELLNNLYKLEKKYLYSDESINDLCIGNDIQFLESGKVYNI